ncbi:MAG: hypothetical protein IIA14_14070 [SAR324 cluster bacterium]|nr:hypothetical protein [SAR324 cluster bacterium]
MNSSVPFETGAYCTFLRDMEKAALLPALSSVEGRNELALSLSKGEASVSPVLSQAEGKDGASPP